MLLPWKSRLRGNNPPSSIVLETCTGRKLICTYALGDPVVAGLATATDEPIRGVATGIGLPNLVV